MGKDELIQKIYQYPIVDSGKIYYIGMTKFTLPMLDKEFKS